MKLEIAKFDSSAYVRLFDPSSRLVIGEQYNACLQYMQQNELEYPDAFICTNDNYSRLIVASLKENAK